MCSIEIELNLFYLFLFSEALKVGELKDLTRKAFDKASQTHVLNSAMRLKAEAAAKERLNLAEEARKSADAEALSSS